MKRVLHLLSAGGTGGIETLCEQIAKRGSAHHEFCFLFGMGEIAERIRDAGIDVYDFSRLSTPSKQIELISLAKKNKYDAVVVHNEGVGIYLLYYLLMKSYKGPMYIKYLHCSYEKEYFFTGNKVKDKLHYSLLGKLLNKSDAVIAVSEFTKKTYVDEFRIPKEKVKVVYNGIEVSQSERPVPGTNPVNLLYIGRLVEIKGVQVLLDALSKIKAQLAEKKIEVHLDILGDGPAGEGLRNKAKELGLSDLVTFHGVQLCKQPYFDKAQIFVYPPIWQEAFGISVIEAMSQGLVCVASRSGGIPEIITNDKQGILFETGDSSALSKALLTAIDIVRGPEAEEYRKAAINRAGFFTIEKSIEGLEQLWKT